MSTAKDADLPSLCRAVEAEYEADVLVFLGNISRPWDDFLIDACTRIKRKNVILLLTTYGGDAHAGYRIARCLQQNYSPKATVGTPKGGKVIVAVSSVCASAGTLITLGADRLILSDHAELGPLDVQLRKPDEVGERTSGLTPIQALRFLQAETSEFFKAQFRSLRFSQELAFSTRLAADISAELASGMLVKLYEQIDPLRLAEYDRTNRIAQHYGERIKTDNVKDDTIKRLLEEYPSHEFCIDITEAKELFAKVEEPTPPLEKLAEFLKPFAQKTLKDDTTAVFFLSEEPVNSPSTTVKNEKDNKIARPNGNASSGGDNEVAGDGEKSTSGASAEHARS